MAPEDPGPEPLTLAPGESAGAGLYWRMAVEKGMFLRVAPEKGHDVTTVRAEDRLDIGPENVLGTVAWKKTPWEAAWDHVAGLLLVEEAGGTHLTRTGEPLRIAGGNALPFTTVRDESAARDETTAGRVAGLLADRV